MSEAQSYIEVLGARQHNLKNIDVRIPHHAITVITGLSGSGKSSLAFDTIYAEGQRRYIETFSSYARHFLGNIERPDVDSITGISPVISIDQKTTNRNARSTVGTTTEIYDFFRLLYARAGTAYSYETGEKMVKYSEEQILQQLITAYQGKRIYILAPLVRNRKGHYRELLESVRKHGYNTVRIDGTLTPLMQDMQLDRYKNHSIEVVIDKFRVGDVDEQRLHNTIVTALKQGEGMLAVIDGETQTMRYFSRLLMCPTTGIAYQDAAPHDFSFNSPQGACPHCKGLGTVSSIEPESIMPDMSLSINDGGLLPLGKNKTTFVCRQIEVILKEYDADLNTPLNQLPQEAIQTILYGSTERILITAASGQGNSFYSQYDGLINSIINVKETIQNKAAQAWANRFTETVACPECHGARLNRTALSYRIDGRNIYEVASMSINELAEWLSDLEDRLEDRQRTIAIEILKEIRVRVKFLLDVGLNYLTLSRAASSLSGGESQRIRLATQIGSQLVNVLYILDEPSIGLHARDNERLINSLKALRDLGNTVIVVEHDRDMMLAADWVIDVGPRAGRYGGNIVFSGTPEQLMLADTLTAKYLHNGIERSKRKYRAGSGKKLSIYGASGNNLKDVNVDFPLGKLICVTGVSGSGKSTLINETLAPILTAHYHRAITTPLPYKRIEGLEYLDKAIVIDQSPLGRTPRSNPATYCGVFTDIRNLFVELPESKARGYKPGRFSFNVAGGRCEKCGGNGYKTIEMNFMPDVYVHCDECNGKRYNRETLEVRYRGKTIADVLDMTINMAAEFFENVPHILSQIKVFQEVGLGYVKLGQSSTTLSGGESQRVKLATELARRNTGKTLYILDEPTTGLHFEDITALMNVLNMLVDKGNTVIIIEHNTDVITQADHIIDMGPEGGKDGGTIVITGTPTKVAASKKGYTARYL